MSKGRMRDRHDPEDPEWRQYIHERQMKDYWHQCQYGSFRLTRIAWGLLFEIWQRITVYGSYRNW